MKNWTLVSTFGEDVLSLWILNNIGLFVSAAKRFDEKVQE